MPYSQGFARANNADGLLRSVQHGFYRRPDACAGLGSAKAERAIEEDKILRAHERKHGRGDPTARFFLGVRVLVC